MRVFYSHPMKSYWTPDESRQISQIERQFSGWEVVNPRENPDRDTQFYLKVIDSCDSLVFSRHFGNVTEGVRPEIDHALSQGKPVYELRDGKFFQVKGPVSNLPMAERLLLRARKALRLDSLSS